MFKVEQSQISMAVSTAGETEGWTAEGSCGNSQLGRISPQEFLRSCHDADHQAGPLCKS